MASDYDLVILGGTLEGRTAALAAARYGARVALVESPGIFRRRQQAKYLLQGLQQLGDSRRRQAVSAWFEQSHSAQSGQSWNSLNKTAPEETARWHWPALLEWSAIAAETQQSQLSEESLSASGVDVILATPERLTRQLTLSAAHRQLTARAVLAAFGSVPLSASDAQNDLLADAAITGIEPLLARASLPTHTVIWGESLAAIAWAEALDGVGVQVSLAVDQFLPQEDSEVREWLRSQLIAKGIQLVHRQEILSEELRAKKNRQLYQQQSLFLGEMKPALTLPGFVYSHKRSRAQASSQPAVLRVNSRLQTAHSRVFACGSVLHGRWVNDEIAQAEAQIAVWNALFFPSKRVDYRTFIDTKAGFASVGQTPRFAKEGYAPTGDYRTWVASAANSADLSSPLPLPAYCKLICHKKRLQSIHLLGEGAEQLAPLLSTEIGQPVDTLLGVIAQSPLPPAAQGITQLIFDAASQSQQSRFRPNHWRRDWAENWFNWRRSR